MGTLEQINNSFYEHYGDRWYTACDDPVALLRAENRIKAPWALRQIDQHFGHRDVTVLDVGCGAGFLSNALSAKGLPSVTGVDVSMGSLEVARRWDTTGRVRYLPGDAYHLPLPCASFDVVAAMDMLEHLEKPEAVVRECARVLKPDGLFLFQTLNRNWVSGLVGIKFVEWFVRNTPEKMHLLRLFIKPGELEGFCRGSGLEVKEMVGVRPRFSTIPLRSWREGVVPESMEFKLSRSRLISYMGVAVKPLR